MSGVLTWEASLVADLRSMVILLVGEMVESKEVVLESGLLG